MKRMLILALLMIFCCAAHAETARDYALYLETALPNAQFADAEVPDFVTRHLGADYDFIAREDEEYGLYIAGVRRQDAPALPEGAHQTAYAGTFESPVFQAADGNGDILYEFVLARDVQMQAYDALNHLVIRIDDQHRGNGEIFLAANPEFRPELLYALERGWSIQDHDRCQLIFPVHNPETWRAGITDQPTSFYLDITPPENLLGERYIDTKDLSKYRRIPIGLRLWNPPDAAYELMLSENGLRGVEGYDPWHRLYEAGNGYEALLDLAEEALGYRPGEMDFIGKKSVRAELQWENGSKALEDPGKLAMLDALFADADFTVGSVNCPSPCFLTLEYADGSSADFAVAVNSFGLFFRNGLYFTAGDGELLDIFGIGAEEIYVQG